MILSRFLKPKWHHNDPATRQQAVQTLDKADPKLIELARQDSDPAIRRVALERLVDLGVLQEIIDSDTDPSVRAAAQERYRTLVAGKIPDGPSLAERLELFRRRTDPGLGEFLLQHATESALRLAALERIEAPESALAEIATQNPHQDVRLAALERVSDPEFLEHIARQARNRDKRLYRQARERLDTLAATRASATYLERLCAEMESLIWDGETGANAGRFPRLEQDWRERESSAAPELRERYAQARSRFLAERQASASRRAQRLELIASLEKWLERLQHEAQPDEALIAAIHQAADDIPSAWNQLGPAQDAESRRLELRFQHLRQEIDHWERTYQRDQSRTERLHQVLRQAETLLEQPSEVRETDLKQLRQRWDGLERPESRSLSGVLQSQFDGWLDKLRARLQRQVQQRDQEWQALQEGVSELETALEAGELEKATHLQEQARDRLKRNIGLTRAQMTAIEERLQHCASRIGELRGWRRWGTHQVREQLCITTESLIGLETDPPELARQIQKLREEWKHLDHHEGAAPKALWKRFNDACERAYAPCQAYFEAQHRERQQNLEKKQALCEHLEQLEAATDWAQPDWREADRSYHRAREQWRELGPVDRTDRKSIERRFQHILQRLDTHLGGERTRERQRRQQLIDQVQSLVAHPDLRAAVEAVKRAQAAWRPSVQASPREEQALWKEFRAACDAVFARRQREQEAAAAERQDNLSRRQELCAAIEALASDEDMPLAKAHHRLQAAQQEWETLGLAPKTEQRALEQRFAAAVEQFAHRERRLQQTHLRERFQQLHARSRVCARLERLLALAPVDPALIDQDRESWEALPPLPAALVEPFQQRFAALVSALTDTPAHASALIATLEAHLAHKQLWCIRMEIMAGVESPPEFAQQRMAYQVARLSASLAGGNKQDTDLHDPHSLQEQWCLTGVLPADADAELDGRFLQALEVWWLQQLS